MTRKTEEVVEAPKVIPPMADDKTAHALEKQGYIRERRAAPATVRMRKDKSELDVSALDVEAHARMGFKVVSEA